MHACSSFLQLVVQPGNRAACIIEYQHDRISIFGFKADFIRHPLAICYSRRDGRMFHSITVVPMMANWHTTQSSIIARLRDASWWRSPATARHQLLRTASSGSESCIASKLNCVASTLMLAWLDGRNAQRHWSPRCRLGSPFIGPASQRSRRSARLWPISPNTGIV